MFDDQLGVGYPISPRGQGQDILPERRQRFLNSETECAFTFEQLLHLRKLASCIYEKQRRRSAVQMAG